MTNSVDPDQTPRSAASDLGLHCLLDLSVGLLYELTILCVTLIPVHHITMRLVRVRPVLDNAVVASTPKSSIANGTRYGITTVIVAV